MKCHQDLTNLALSLYPHALSRSALHNTAVKEKQLMQMDIREKRGRSAKPFMPMLNRRIDTVRML